MWACCPKFYIYDINTFIISFSPSRSPPFSPLTLSPHPFPFPSSFTLLSFSLPFFYHALSLSSSFLYPLSFWRSGKFHVVELSNLRMPLWSLPPTMRRCTWFNASCFVIYLFIGLLLVSVYACTHATVYKCKYVLCNCVCVLVCVSVCVRLCVCLCALWVCVCE